MHQMSICGEESSSSVRRSMQVDNLEQWRRNWGVRGALAPPHFFAMQYQCAGLCLRVTMILKTLEANMGITTVNGAVGHFEKPLRGRIRI